MLLDEIRFLAPELALLATALAVVLLDLFVKRKKVLAGVSFLGVLLAAGLSMMLWGGEPISVFYDVLWIDPFAVFFKFLFLAAAGLVVLCSQDYVSKFEKFQGEYYALVLIATVGVMLLAATADLIAVYVALELSSISLYALAAFLKDEKSTEAGLKYLLLGAIASAVLLYGMALTFGLTGTTKLASIAQTVTALTTSGLAQNPALLVAIVLLVAGFGFKIASFPFHMWVPDVYEGAPTPITAYLSVASKAAGFAIILRVFSVAFGSSALLSTNWGILFAVLSALTMTIGNVIALWQRNIKRLLGYSSIAQAGYLMVGLATVGIAAGIDKLGQSGLLFFLVSYTVTNLGAFSAVIAISNKVGSDLIDDYAGMGKRAPVLAPALTFCLVSLIGLPPTAGLIAKVYIFSAAVQHGLLGLVIVAVINTCISAYYYLKVVKVMWLGAPVSLERVPSSWALRAAVLVCCLLVLVLGIVPSSFIRLAELAAWTLGF